MILSSKKYDSSESEKVFDDRAAHSSNEQETSTIVRNVDLVLESPGRCIATLIDTLRPAMLGDLRGVAKKVFTAPSILIKGISREKAQQIEGLLSDLGAKLSIREHGVQLLEQSCDFETAIVVHDAQQMPQILQQLASLLRLKIEQVIELFRQSPVLIMGNLSAASASAIGEAFQLYDVSVIISDKNSARYDLYLCRDAFSIRNELLVTIRKLGLKPFSDAEDAGQPLLVTMLSQVDSLKIWEQYHKFGDQIKIVNRDFYTFDLRWQKISDEGNDDEIAAYLNKCFKIPTKVFLKLKSSDGLILAEDLLFDEVELHLSQLSSLGAHCMAELTTLRKYTCKIIKSDDQEAVIATAALITGLKPKALKADYLSSSKVLARSLTRFQARWLQSELQRMGCKVEMTPNN